MSSPDAPRDGAATTATVAPATWGAAHFDSAPTDEQLWAIEEEEQAKKAAAAASRATPQQLQQQLQQQQLQQQRDRASVVDAAKSIKPEDFLKVYQYPCARQGYLFGIGGGAAVGALRYIVGASAAKAANWAVGAFALVGIVSYETCQALRRAEREKMKRVVEVYDKKQAEMRQREEERRRRRKQKEEEEAEAARAAAQRRWYKFW